MRKIIKIFKIILVLILLKYTIIFSLNELVITDYKKGVYNDQIIKILYLLTYNQSYIVYYNHGNLLYNQNNYQEAIQKYDQSLTKNPPQNRVCDIRINKSLAILATVIDSNDKESLKILKTARYNLYENNCVDPNYLESYSKDAEKLEKEIKELEKQYDDKMNDQDNDNNNQDENESNSEDDIKYKQIEEQIRQNEKEANKARQEDLDNAKNLDNYEYYPGKNW